jgi:hypothetical protein
MEEFLDLYLPTANVDIYTIDQPRYSVYKFPHSSNDCIHDDSNCISISLIQAIQKGIPTVKISAKNVTITEMKCSKCLNPAMYIRKLNHEYLCPACFFIQAKTLDGVRAACCDNPLGCDSCGGVSAGQNKTRGMIEISDSKYGELFLCARDECLSPFGYCISPLYHDVPCTCEYDASKEIVKIMGRDPGSVTVKYINAATPSRSERFEGLSTDFRQVSASYCLRCQLFEDRKVVSKSWFVDGGSKVCSCSSVFWGRRGSGSLSTLNTPSRRRRKSSGDLRDEYTPSTSEI